MPEVTIFDILNSINEKKELEFEDKEFSNYMVSMWLSHDRECISYVNKINKFLFTIKPKVLYNYYYASIPKRKRYIRYTKKSKVESFQNGEKLKLKYKLSDKELLQYKELLK